MSCNVFWKFPLLAWVAWQLQYSPTACGTLGKHFTQPSEQVAAPDCMLVVFEEFSKVVETGEMGITTEIWAALYPGGRVPWLGWLRFVEFPRLVGRYCNYLLPKQNGGTSQILVNPTKVSTTTISVPHRTFSCWTWCPCSARTATAAATPRPTATTSTPTRRSASSGSSAASTSPATVSFKQSC